MSDEISKKLDQIQEQLFQIEGLIKFGPSDWYEDCERDEKIEKIEEERLRKAIEVFNNLGIVEIIYPIDLNYEWENKLFWKFVEDRGIKIYE